jgi:hypothetical protein
MILAPHGLGLMQSLHSLARRGLSKIAHLELTFGTPTSQKSNRFGVSASDAVDGPFTGT